MRVRNTKTLRCRNAVTMMVGTTRIRRSEAMYSPRKFQIARKWVRANIRPVERVLCSGLCLCRWMRLLVGDSEDGA